MKANIHPTIYTDAIINCTSCGNTFTTSSTKKAITVDVCYKCHPYYTGEHRFIDTQGRVEHFQNKQKVAAAMKEKLATSKKSKKKNNQEEQEPKTLKELLSEI